MQDGLPQSSVNCMATTAGGYLWLGTHGGLARFDGLTFAVFDLANTPELGSNRIYELFVDSEERLWIGTLQGGVTCFANGRFTHYSVDLGAPRGPVSDFAEDADGIVWAMGHQISRFVGGQFERVWEAGRPHRLWAAEGTVWADLGDGFLRLDMQGAHPHESPPDADVVDVKWGSTLRLVSEREGIPRIELRVTHLDGDGQLWCGTDRYGLYRVREAVFERWQTRRPNRSNYCIASDSEGEIWIAPNHKPGVSRYVAGRVVETLLGDPAAPLRSIRGLFWASDGTLWTRHGRYVTAIHEARTVLHDLGCSSEYRSPMAEAPDGAVWCGVGNALFRIDEEGWSRFGDEGGLEMTGLITSIVATRDGAMWVGSQSVVYRWDGERFARFDTTDGIPRGFVRAFCEASDGTFWIGTYGGGLGRFDGETCVRYGVEDGLPNNSISAILDDGAGHLWIQSNAGVFAVSLDELATYVPGSQAIPVRLFEIGESQGPGAVLGRDGLAVFPVLDGVVALDTIRASAPRILPPKVFIEDMRAGQAPVELGRPITLGPDRRNIEIDYTSPNLFDPMGIRFRHRLVGYDDEWTAAGARRKAAYTGLPPGRYTFEVAAIDSSGRQSENAVLSFDVRPTIVETTWFAALVIIATLGLVLVAFRSRVRTISAHNLSLRAEIEERVLAERALRGSKQELRSLSHKLITAQDDERKSIARELHDDFTQRLAALSIQAEMLADGAAATTDGKDRALEVAKMAQQLTTDVQQLSRRLHPSSLQDLGLVRAARSECDTFSKREGITVHFVSDDVPDDLQQEVTLAAFRVLQESLHNVEKHAATAIVHVTLSVEDGDLSLAIVDSGRGFDTDGLHEGIGLVSMRERAISIAGSLTVESRIGEGTTVQMRVPLAGPTKEAAR